MQKLFTAGSTKLACSADLVSALQQLTRHAEDLSRQEWGYLLF